MPLIRIFAIHPGSPDLEQTICFVLVGSAAILAILSFTALTAEPKRRSVNETSAEVKARRELYWQSLTISLFLSICTLIFGLPGFLIAAIAAKLTSRRS